LAHLIDGKYGNDFSWISNQAGAGWVQLEFAQVERINRVVWSRDRGTGTGHVYDDRIPTRYKIEVSTDAKTWTPVASSADRPAARPLVYAGIFEQPGPTHRNNRGDPTQPKETVAPGMLSSIGTRLTLPENTPEPERRLALANWIADPHNPLTARVIVNRLWHYHFAQAWWTHPAISVSTVRVPPIRNCSTGSRANSSPSAGVSSTSTA
jgi:hypothetical protein